METCTVSPLVTVVKANSQQSATFAPYRALHLPWLPRPCHLNQFSSQRMMMAAGAPALASRRVPCVTPHTGSARLRSGARCVHHSRRPSWHHIFARISEPKSCERALESAAELKRNGDVCCSGTPNVGRGSLPPVCGRTTSQAERLPRSSLSRQPKPLSRFARRCAYFSCPSRLYVSSRCHI